MIHINIGSNQGDSTGMIARAVALILDATDCADAGRHRVSEPFAGPAWGYESASPYINVGLSLYPDNAPGPEQLLRILLDIECSLSVVPHRNADGSYRDREIDIDLIAVDDMEIHTPRLTLPHPRMHLREFVLVPLSHTDSQWRHPANGMTASEMLRRLQAADQHS